VLTQGIAARFAVCSARSRIVSPPDGAWGTVDQMLEILASVPAPAVTSRSRRWRHLELNHISAVSGCVCVLQAWDEARRSLVKKMRALNVRAAGTGCHPAGRREAGPPVRCGTNRTGFSAGTGQIEQGLPD